MRSLRRLSVVSIAPLSAVLVLCAAGVRAQTTAAPAAPVPLQKAAPFAAQLPPLFSTGQSSVPQLSGPATTFRLPPLSIKTIRDITPLDTIHSVQAIDPRQQAILLAQNSPCYTMRTYGFTAGHDPAEAPHLSSSTTCTPSSRTHVRELVKIAPSH